MPEEHHKQPDKRTLAVIVAAVVASLGHEAFAVTDVQKTPPPSPGDTA